MQDRRTYCWGGKRIALIWGALLPGVIAFTPFSLQTGLRSALDAVVAAPTLSGKQEVDMLSLLGDDESTEEVVTSETAGKFPQSAAQIQSIRSSSPALLLSSGPGTGKTYTLASKVAHLLQEEACAPDRVVLMSFSNRDAEVLKSKALDQLFPSSDKNSSLPFSRQELSDRLWSGTIHMFAKNIVRAYSPRKQAVRVVSDRETKMRIDRCLRQLLNENSHKGPRGSERLKKVRLLHRDALVELRQSRDVMIHQVGRCIELWKEASILPPPQVQGITINTAMYQGSKQETRDNCLELATRLGITQNVAYLAWTIFPMYQNFHERHNTADPADLASIAFHLLLSRPDQLRKLRTKLNHVILDEYQDISVAQHSLVRLVVRGVVDELDESQYSNSKSVPPVLLESQSLSTTSESELFDVPRLFCAGDSQQSIYGFRGAAPQLSVGGFRRDFPQGTTVRLDTSFRLADSIWSAVSSLQGGVNQMVDTFQKSPVGAAKARETLFEALTQCTSDPEAETLTDLLAEDLDDDLTDSVHVQGVWDAREEAKHIAMLIKRRAKERTGHVASAMKALLSGKPASMFVDPSDVSIVVRASNQLPLIREALSSAGVPFVDLNGQTKHPAGKRAASMKPVVLMTMHGSKGEEFDDVYLPGWTEGVFPHPSAVSANRVDEERRLAYVAISRARHQVVITHAFVRRAMHVGSDRNDGTNNMHKKRVTMQVRPSRFLYELVPNGVHSTENVVDNNDAIKQSEESHLPAITWDRSQGSKGSIAGTKLPDYFQKSYRTPKGFSAPEHQDPELLIMERQLKIIQNPKRPRANLSAISKKKKKSTNRKALQGTKKKIDQDAPIVLTPTKLAGGELELVLEGINSILSGKWGSATKYRPIFHNLLKGAFGLSRGKITLFPFEKEAKALPELTLSSYDTLIQEASSGFSTRPLSQATALQLGLFLLYSLLRHESTTQELLPTVQSNEVQV